MLFYFTSRIIWYVNRTMIGDFQELKKPSHSSISAFLYPGYSSYKTLSQRPASEEEIERWLMYWSVLGCIVAAEYVAEWLVSWIPFYYLLKTVFLLYLSLPQTRGSSYLYVNHLQPFFHTHEAQIDAALASFKARIYTFLQERIRMLWEHVSATLSQQQQQQQPRANFMPAGGASNAGPPPSLGDPMSGPATLVSNLWNWYGPGILAGGAALLRQGTAPAPNQAFASPTSSPTGRKRHDTSESVLERRRRLEAELASLPPTDPFASTTALPMPQASTSYQSSRSSSDGDLRDRSTASGMKFEEVEVPSDVEGYDIGGGSRSSGERPDAGKRNSSWFGWAGTPGKEDKVKSD
jgi:receptor expression-enhancing protein 1/2/3/4